MKSISIKKRNTIQVYNVNSLAFISFSTKSFTVYEVYCSRAQRFEEEKQTKIVDDIFSVKHNALFLVCSMWHSYEQFAFEQSSSNFHECFRGTSLPQNPNVMMTRLIFWFCCFFHFPFGVISLFGTFHFHAVTPHASVHSLRWFPCVVCCLFPVVSSKSSSTEKFQCCKTLNSETNQKCH